MSPPKVFQTQSSIVLPMDLDKYPIDSEKISKIKPKMRIDYENNTFKLTVNVAGFKKDDVNVFAGNGKIAVKAIGKVAFNNLNICKVYKAEYTVPAGVAMDKLRRSYQDGVLCIRGVIDNSLLNSST